jgi:glycosyltransferase involved in cell wall biosynthesis
VTNREVDPNIATARNAYKNEIPAASRPSVCVVGPGWRFTSGISYYTCRLVNAFADDYKVSVIQLRQLLPKRFYPGKERVGQPRAAMSFSADVPVFDGVDWWWGLSLFRALSFMRANRPRVLVLEWWTATTLHTYLVLAIAAHLLGARVVLEMHESQDPGEASMPLIRRYGRWGLGLLLRISDGCVLHSKADQRLLEETYDSANIRVAVAPHGPFDQYRAYVEEGFVDDVAVAAVRKAPRPAVVNLLFFGLIRPYKGLEDLLDVYNALLEDEVAGLWLTVVGETWDGCTEPARLIETSPHRDRITFVNEYVPDEVVGAAFAHADVVVLPYRRSSSSGTLHVAMSYGLPVVVTSVGGLPEAADGYEGAIFVPPGDVMLLKTAIKEAVRIAGRRFHDPRDWAETVDALLYAADAGLKNNVNSEGPSMVTSRDSPDPAATDRP